MRVSVVHSCTTVYTTLTFSGGMEASKQEILPIRKSVEKYTFTTPENAKKNSDHRLLESAVHIAYSEQVELSLGADNF